MQTSSLTIKICPRWKSPWRRMLRPSMSWRAAARQDGRARTAAVPAPIDQRTLGLPRGLAPRFSMHRTRVRPGPSRRRSSAARPLPWSVPARNRQFRRGRRARDASRPRVFRSAPWCADRGLAPRLRRDARCLPADADPRRNDRDRPRSRSSHRPDSGQRHARSRSRFAVAFGEFHAAEQRGHVGKIGDVGQEPADLDFGIDAGFQLSKQLDRVLAVDQRGAVDCSVSTARTRSGGLMSRRKTGWSAGIRGAGLVPRRSIPADCAASAR